MFGMLTEPLQRSVACWARSQEGRRLPEEGGACKPSCWAWPSPASWLLLSYCGACSRPFYVASAYLASCTRDWRCGWLFESLHSSFSFRAACVLFFFLALFPPFSGVLFDLGDLMFAASLPFFLLALSASRALTYSSTFLTRFANCLSRFCLRCFLLVVCLQNSSSELCSESEEDSSSSIWLSSIFSTSCCSVN